MFDEDDSDHSNGSFVEISKTEEKKRGESDSVEEDAEITKGDDFTDSDEDDLTLRFNQ
jgi:hypothetical protein